MGRLAPGMLPSHQPVPRVPQPAPERWSLSYARRLYVEGAIEADQYEDLIGWVLGGGDLTLSSTRPPWPWRGR